MKQSLITMNKILRESLYFRKDSNISRFSQILQHMFPKHDLCVSKTFHISAQYA